MMELTETYLKLKLKPDAVPTRFDFSLPKIKCQIKGMKTSLASKFEMQDFAQENAAVGGTFGKRVGQAVF